MTLQELRARLAACNLLAFHQIHLYRAGQLAEKGAEVATKAHTLVLLLSGPAAPEVEDVAVAEQAYYNAKAELDAMLADLADIESSAAVTNPTM